jgi:hypothetical protein
LPVCLGRLESSDFATLPAQRKEVVQAFWTEYFSDAGAPTEIQLDGTGMLTEMTECLDSSQHAFANDPKKEKLP